MTGIKRSELEKESFKTYLDIKKNINNIKATKYQINKLKAIFEIVERIEYEKISHDNITITSPSVVVNYLKAKLIHYDNERFYVVYLNTKNRIIGEEIISIGTVNASLINPRELFINALKNQAVNIIIAHNHPSGNSTPSKEDISITKRIKETGDLIGIRLLDHIIIGNDYFSFKEKGYV